MATAEDNQNAANEEEYEEVEEIEEVEEEEEEEVEEVEEEEGAGDGGGGEELGGGEGYGLGGGTTRKGIGNVDSAGEEVKSSVSSSSSAGKIFVGGVAWETTGDTFRAHFEKYGKIIDSVIMVERHTKRPRGFGFVTFEDPSVIDKVLEDEQVIDGRMVEVKRTVPREDMTSKEGPKTKKIFVGGIPSSLTEDQFKEHFSSYGKVIEHQIMVDHASGRSRGFGFVTFENEDSVEKIISEGRMHDLGGKQVEIKKAEPRKPGDSGFSNRGAYGAGSGNMYGFYGSSGSSYRYGTGYQSGGFYYGSRAGGGYGRGYSYGAGTGYGACYGSGLGGTMSGSGGYGTGSSYSGPGGYGGAYGSYSGGTGRGYGNRYHPYGR